MKSRIQWIEKQSEDGYGTDIDHVYGYVDKCDTFLNLYYFQDAWHWSVRSKRLGVNLIASNGWGIDDLEEAKKHVCKWAVVQFLRQIDPAMIRRCYGNNSIYWYEPEQR